MSRFQEKEKYLYIFIYVKYKENDFSQDYKVHISDIIILFTFFLPRIHPLGTEDTREILRKKKQKEM